MTRDITEKQFRAALERNNLELAGPWKLWIQRKGDTSISIGLIVNAKTLRPLYRRSLAHALQTLDKHDEERAARAAALAQEQQHPEEKPHETTTDVTC